MADATVLFLTPTSSMEQATLIMAGFSAALPYHAATYGAATWSVESGIDALVSYSNRMTIDVVICFGPTYKSVLGEDGFPPMEMSEFSRLGDDVRFTHILYVPKADDVWWQDIENTSPLFEKFAEILGRRVHAHAATISQWN